MMRTGSRISLGLLAAAALGAAGVTLAHNEAPCPAGHEEHCGTAAAPARGMGGMDRMGMHGGMGMHDGMGMRGGMPMRGAGMHGGGGADMAALRSELNLTAAQTPAWDAWASAVQRQVAARQGMRDAMHSGKVDHDRMHETMSRFGTESAKEVDEARRALYAVLTPEQRTIADRRTGPGRMMAGGMMGQGRHGH